MLLGGLAAAVGRAACFSTASRATLLPSAARTTNCHVVRRTFSARSEHMDGTMRKLLLYKRIFGASLFSVTVVGCYWLKKRKGDRLKDLLQDCTRVTLEQGHYEDNISLYRYKGYVLPGQIVLSGVLQQLPNFQFRDTDVLVASFPKTGTTWVQEIVYMLKHRCQATSGDDATLETRFPYLEYPYPGLRAVSSTAGQRCIKTHLPYSLLPPSLHSAGSKVVYVTRNPRDTAVSYYHFVKLLTTSGFLGDLQDFIDNFLKDKVPYSPFFGHVRSYYSERDNPAVLFLTYEQLSTDPAAVVAKIAQHLNVAVSEEDIEYVVAHTSFSAMSSNPSVNYDHWKQIGFARTDRGNFLRKGKVGDWRNRLSEEQVVRFEDWERSNTIYGDCRLQYSISQPMQHR